jgi:DNA-binding beta-propeller fold protein YncE
MHDVPQQITKTLGKAFAVCALALSVAACPAGQQQVQTKKDFVWPEPPDEPRLYWESILRSSSDVLEESSSQRFKRMATGAGMLGKPLEKPYGVAAFDGIVYVSDTIMRQIHAFDIPGRRYFEIGKEGSGAVAKPLDMAIDGSGKLYVCDGSGRRVAMYDREGKYLGTLGGKDELHRPSGLAVNKAGTRIYVVDTGGVDSDKHRVAVFDNTGKHLFDIGKRGNEPGNFNLPVSATIGPDGTLYVVDGGNFRVQAFDPDGKFLFTFGTVGRRSGQFSRPKGIAVDKDGNLYVTDSAFGNFQIFDKKGRLLLYVGDRGNDGGPGQLMLPAGITVDQVDGRVYVVDQFFKKVEGYRPVGTPVERPRRLTAQADGKAADGKAADPKAADPKAKK